MITNAENTTSDQNKKLKLNLIEKILNSGNNANISIEKKVMLFDKLYELPYAELLIYHKVYK